MFRTKKSPAEASDTTWVCRGICICLIVSAFVIGLGLAVITQDQKSSETLQQNLTECAK